MGLIVLSLVLCMVFALSTAACLMGLGRTMSWYARPFWAFFIYIIPTLVLSLVAILVHANYFTKVR